MRKIKNLSQLRSSSEIRREYFWWLCGLVDIAEEIMPHGFQRLAVILHEKEFYWSIPNDDNRAEDGKKLREIFVQETGCIHCEEAFENKPCSMLEMLIAVAIRIESVLENPEKGNRTKSWFWEIIRNLGLDEYTDDNFGKGCRREIDDILEKVLRRRYPKTGEGGMFPLRKTRNDQRKVEIWYQMMEYLDQYHQM